ncbi:hypothetical protein ACVJBD_003218 [Rhizobium mongolense]
MRGRRVSIADQPPVFQRLFGLGKQTCEPLRKGRIVDCPGFSVALGQPLAKVFERECSLQRTGSDTREGVGRFCNQPAVRIAKIADVFL